MIYYTLVKQFIRNHFMVAFFSSFEHFFNKNLSKSTHENVKKSIWKKKKHQFYQNFISPISAECTLTEIDSLPAPTDVVGSKRFQPSKKSRTYRRLSSTMRNPVMLIAPNSLISDSHRSSNTFFAKKAHKTLMKCKKFETCQSSTKVLLLRTPSRYSINFLYQTK